MTDVEGHEVREILVNVILGHTDRVITTRSNLILAARK